MEDDFATLFEASLKAKKHETGQTIEGTIVAIGPEVAFVNVGGKGEATIDVAELKDDDGVLEAKAGDRIQAVVVSTTGGLVLSRKLARGAATAKQLEDAYHSGLPVDGKVERVIKGGYEIKIGRARGFCPFSQIDTVRQADQNAPVGHVYAFKITEFKENGRNLVVSRRALLEREQEAKAAEVRQTIVPGAVLTGRVVSVRDFGAFIDLGAGIQGLLHISEMGWSRVADAAQVVQPGDAITVKVLRVDDKTNQIALGLKQLQADPWTTVPERYAVGQVHTGRVTRVAEFGAFVELEPGVEALAHASTFPPSGKGGWAKTVTPGLTGAFEVLSLDPDKKRIGVAMVDAASARAGTAAPARAAIVPGARMIGKVEKHEKFGVFVYLAPGKTGLMPWSETGVAKETDVPQVMPVGSDVEVIVREVDPAGRRIRVSRKAVQDAQEAAEVQDYNAREQTAQGDNFSSLADKLKRALAPRPTRGR